MRKLLTALVVAAICALPTVVTAGGSCGSSGAENKSGFQCTNQCPLAQKANSCRAKGAEASKTSGLVLNDLAKKVAANLKKI